MERKPISAAAHTAAALRSQLNQIAAASQMLEMSAEGRSRSYLAVINQGICRMLRIVGRIGMNMPVRVYHILLLSLSQAPMWC